MKTASNVDTYFETKFSDHAHEGQDQEEPETLDEREDREQAQATEEYEARRREFWKKYYELERLEDEGPLEQFLKEDAATNKFHDADIWYDSEGCEHSHQSDAEESASYDAENNRDHWVPPIG